MPYNSKSTYSYPTIIFKNSRRTIVHISCLAALVPAASAQFGPPDKSWANYRVGDHIEVDPICSGEPWRPVIITQIEPTTGNYPFKITGTKDDGAPWTFSGPGAYAPCLRMQQTSAAAAPAEPRPAFAPPVSAPGGPPQPLQGLYLQLQNAGGANQYIHYYFWKDGRVCYGLPSGGLDREPADFASVQQHSVKCGTYVLTGSRMAVRLTGDAPYQASIANFRGDSFEMNQYATAKVGNYGAGKRLSGTFTATTYAGNDLYKFTYIFQPNGTYGFTRVPVIRGTPQTFAGTYTLSGNTLSLTGSDTPKKTAYPFPNGDMMIDGGVFTNK